MRVEANQIVVRGEAQVVNISLNAQGLLVAPVPVDNSNVQPFLIDAAGQKTPLTLKSATPRATAKATSLGVENRVVRVSPSLCFLDTSLHINERKGMFLIDS